jgi:hypothetical protein
MDTKANAYAVLELCQNDPNYSNMSLDTDISRHIRNHMGIVDWPTWRPLYEHIGFTDEQGRELWYLLDDEELSKENALFQFERMIEQQHGTLEGMFPVARRLL